ncbi:MAG TPA: glycosyltransferase [Ktedonobacteraceae bacterium]|nr:glycosyltransferase [Ktedonobacteraceae bacterium]
MLDRQNILILTSKTGGGHVSLAESLRDRLADNYTIEIIDPQPVFFHLHYRLVSRYALWLWAAEFQYTDSPRRALFAHRVFTRLVAKQLHALVERIQPACIITTYPFLSYEMMRVLEQRNDHIPFAMLLADPNNVHASWLTERHADAIFAPTRETYAQCLKAGIDPQRVHLTGWPVRNQFYHAGRVARSETLNKLHLDPDRFTVFLQGGGEGAAKFGRTVETVLGAGENVQVILATGTNTALLNRFNNVKNLYALPFTKDIATYMAAADVIMGKAGPNMLFESVTLGKPFIATAYIPGQEEVNLDFIRRHSLGWVALESAQQQTLVQELASTPAILHGMQSSVQIYREWNTSATEAIVPLIEGMVCRAPV